MGDKSKIEWTDATWNPVTGCTRVSEGCRHCYAERVAARLAQNPTTGRYRGVAKFNADGEPRWTGKLNFLPDVLAQPLRWARPRRIFVNSMSDLFHESLENEQVAAVFGVMAAARQHTFQVLTKRAARMVEWFRWVGGNVDPAGVCRELAAEALKRPPPHFADFGPDWPLRSVHVGVSAERQEEADERVPLLLQCPAAVHWVSTEPLIGPLDLSRWMGPGGEVTDDALDAPDGAEVDGAVRSGGRWRRDRAVSWVVVGGESGAGARPMHPDWARSLRDQCRETGVAYHFKQWGEWAPHEPVAGGDLGADVRSERVRIVRQDRDDDGRFRPNDVWMWRVGKKAAGRLLDGALHDEYPRAGAHP